MAEKKFSAILTLAGTERMAAAALSGMPVGFSEMAVGDGGGALPQPDPSRTRLINERYRAKPNRLIVADQAANVIRAELLIPPQTGGFWLREAALFGEDGVCLAVANIPESYKPELAEGAGRSQSVNIWIAVSNTADVKLLADPSVILASMEEVNRARSEAKDYADNIAGELDSSLKTVISEAITEAVAAAKRDFWEEENPVGTVRFYAKKVNPNTLYPWSTWVYTGENKSIRIGKADGTNVGQAAGSDTATITQANLPKVKISLSGETDEHNTGELKTNPTDLGTKKTGKSGNHKHRGGHGGPGDKWGTVSIGTDNQNYYDTRNTSEDGEHDHQLELGEHFHSIPAIKHKHQFTGETDNLGEGKTISIVEAHTLLMCWARTA